MKTHDNINRALKKQKRRGKYNALKCVHDGYKFDSLREGKYYLIYRDLQNNGEISDLELHPVFKIIINGRIVCKVILDFQFYDNKLNYIRYIDVKGVDTPISKLKRKIVEAQFGIKVEVVK